MFGKRIASCVPFIRTVPQRNLFRTYPFQIKPLNQCTCTRKRSQKGEILFTSHNMWYIRACWFMNTFIIILHGKDTQLLPNYQIILQKQYATKKGRKQLLFTPLLLYLFQKSFRLLSICHLRNKFDSHQTDFFFCIIIPQLVHGNR